MFQFNLLIGILLDLDFKKYNPVDDEEKSNKVIDYIVEEAKRYNGSYLAFFESILENMKMYMNMLRHKKRKLIKRKAH